MKLHNAQVALQSVRTARSSWMNDHTPSVKLAHGKKHCSDVLSLNFRKLCNIDLLTRIVSLWQDNPTMCGLITSWGGHCGAWLHGNGCQTKAKLRAFCSVLHASCCNERELSLCSYEDSHVGCVARCVYVHLLPLVMTSLSLPWQSHPRAPFSHLALSVSFPCEFEFEEF